MSARIMMFILSFISTSCLGGELQEALNRAGLVERQLPTDHAWTAANRSVVDYRVTNDTGQLAIDRVRTAAPRAESRVTFHGQAIIGSNRGEWGGMLSLRTADGSEQILLRDNIVQLVQEKDELFVFTGLAHLGYAQGAIYKVTGDKNLTAEKVTLLPGATEVVTVERNARGYFAFLIVTNDGLVSYSPSLTGMKVLAIDQFWHGLYPNSAQLCEGQLVIGMRSGVAVIDLGQNSLSAAPRVTKVRYFAQAMP